MKSYVHEVSEKIWLCVEKKQSPQVSEKKTKHLELSVKKTKHLGTTWTSYKNKSTWNFGQTLKEWPKNHREYVKNWIGPFEVKKCQWGKLWVSQS